MADPQNPPNSAPDGTSTPPAKKVPTKAAKAPAKKVPPKNPNPTPPQAANQPPCLQQRIENNDQLDVAKNVAEQAQSAVESASNPVSNSAGTLEASNSPVALVTALALSLLALLLIRQMRRH
ncbi:hypothetical protein [Mycobacterium lepromatosis]|uniref:Histone-like protein n=1 Tax=Mycobacterium lepromatosis TaxID=480418 RepID=A0A0F4EST9_9MYCO|nr:hypothetical protein [Mycobacterium lepromatosis]KJX75899.1 histone-like protein [Mycobacterium lepromatosis]UKN41459.1 nucleoid-structuring protein H-NS [Mycobacterium lepromatosis]